MTHKKNILHEHAGEYLRKIRETSGYTVEDVANATKINPHYIEAIEKEEFSKLPADIFVKGFLRSYIEFLGIENGDDVVQEFIAARNASKPAQGRPSVTPPFEGSKASPLRAYRTKIIISASLITILFLLGVIFFIPGREKVPTRSSDNINMERASPPARGITPADINKDSRVGTPFKFTIVVKEMTWIRADIDGHAIKDVILRPGDRVTWKGLKRVTMTIGNAGGIEEIKVGDKVYTGFGESGDVLRNIIITRDGITGWKALPRNTSMPG